MDTKFKSELEKLPKLGKESSDCLVPFIESNGKNNQPTQHTTQDLY